MLRLAALAGVVVAAHAKWTHQGGSNDRRNIWPVGGETAPAPAGARSSDRGFDAPREAESAPVAQQLAAATPLPAPPVVPALMKSFGQEYHLTKKMAPITMSTGDVIAVSDDCEVIALKNPDTYFKASSDPNSWPNWQVLWTYRGAVNQTLHANCPDAILDDSDNVYIAACDDNILKCYLHKVMQPKLSGFPRLAWVADLGGSMRILEEHNIGIMHVAGKIYVPMAPILDQGLAGLVMVDATTGSVTHTLEQVDAGGAGSVRIPIYGQPDGAAFIVSYLDGLSKGPSMVGFDSTGLQVWSSQFTQRSDVDAQHPMTDPYNGYIYQVSYRAANPDPSTTFKCIDPATGKSCNPAYYPTPFGVALPNDFGNAVAQYIYAGTILPNAARTATDRVIYTLASQDTGSNPAGCIIAINPSDGALDKTADMYCLPRAKGNLDFIATSPLMALDARGPGQHTVFFADFNCTVYAFDPRALSKGPLYTFTAVPSTETATVVSDYLSMTDSGSLLMATWRDDTAMFTVVAIPNVLSIGSTGDNNAKSSGMSPGGAATLSIFIIGLVGVGVATYMGYLPAVSKAISSVVAKVSGGYSKVGFSASSGSSTGSSLFKGGAGGYAGFGSAAASSSAAAAGSSSGTATAPISTSSTGGYNSI